MRVPKYYVLLAADGVFIHTNYERTVICKNRYFRSPYFIKKFESLEEAAIDHLWDVADFDREIPEHLVVDSFHYIRKLPHNG